MMKNSATNAQLELLRKKRVPENELTNLTKREASKLIDRVIAAEDQSKNRQSETGQLALPTLLNPTPFFLLGAFLILMNLGVPQFSAVPYETATITMKYAFDVILGTGSIGSFLFLSGFGWLITNLFESQIDEFRNRRIILI